MEEPRQPLQLRHAHVHVIVSRCHVRTESCDAASFAAAATTISICHFLRHHHPSPGPNLTYFISHRAAHVIAQSSKISLSRSVIDPVT